MSMHCFGSTFWTAQIHTGAFSAAVPGLSVTVFSKVRTALAPFSTSSSCCYYWIVLPWVLSSSCLDYTILWGRLALLRSWALVHGARPLPCVRCFRTPFTFCWVPPSLLGLIFWNSFLTVSMNIFSSLHWSPFCRKAFLDSSPQPSGDRPWTVSSQPFMGSTLESWLGPICISLSNEYVIPSELIFQFSC